MNKRKAAIYAWRNSISKYSKPFVSVWARKLTTKERTMLNDNPNAMFMQRMRDACQQDEYDEEAEHDLDAHYGIDGWGEF